MQTAYPVDGCGPLEGPDVAKYDSQWMLVSPEFDVLVTDDYPMLEQVTLTYRLGYITLTAPGMLRLDLVPDVIEDDESVWRQAHDVDGTPFTVVDEGDLAAAWFSDYIAEPCRLVKRLDASA